jgi:mitochondrial fission protein ELM1
MNNIIEKKLRDCKIIISFVYVDGTHGTKYELTTVLVKDDENMGLPVAFTVSKRSAQTSQQVIFKALREK